VDRRLRDGLPALTWNPFRDEGDAFQLVLVTIAVGGLVVAGSWISTWVGIGAVVALVVAGCVLLWRRRRARVSVVEPAKRVLLVGEPSRELLAALGARAEVRVAIDIASVEDALRTFLADEIVVVDPAIEDGLRARFVVPVRAARAADYLPETAASR
jgi:hypothetical protein